MAHLTVLAQRAPGPPRSCGLLHFYTSQACDGQDVWTALTAHPTSCNSYPQAICTCTTWVFLPCSTSGALQTPCLCKHALEKTPEVDSSCFAQPAQTSCCTSLRARLQSQMTDRGPPSCCRVARARQTWSGCGARPGGKTRWCRMRHFLFPQAQVIAASFLWSVSSSKGGKRSPERHTLWLWGFQALCQELASILVFGAPSANEKKVVSGAWQPPTHTDKPWTGFLVESSTAELHEVKAHTAS